jgi:hypothetical protein
MSRLKEQTLSLECVLTLEEKLQCSKVQNDAISAMQNAEAQLLAFKSQMKSEIDGAQAIINLQQQKILSGKEFRPVKCRVIYDFDKKEKCWIREDTGEIAKQDVIPENEIQEEMELQAKAQEVANEEAEKSGKKKK